MVVVGDVGRGLGDVKKSSNGKPEVEPAGVV
jgi:hypothetical protein